METRILESFVSRAEAWAAAFGSDSISTPCNLAQHIEYKDRWLRVEFQGCLTLHSFPRAALTYHRLGG